MIYFNIYSHFQNIQEKATSCLEKLIQKIKRVSKNIGNFLTYPNEALDNYLYKQYVYPRLNVTIQVMP